MNSIVQACWEKSGIPIIIEMNGNLRYNEGNIFPPALDVHPLGHVQHAPHDLDPCHLVDEAGSKDVGVLSWSLLVDSAALNLDFPSNRNS